MANAQWKWCPRMFFRAIWSVQKINQCRGCFYKLPENQKDCIQEAQIELLSDMTRQIEVVNWIGLLYMLLHPMYHIPGTNTDSKASNMCNAFLLPYKFKQGVRRQISCIGSSFRECTLSLGSSRSSFKVLIFQGSYTKSRLDSSSSTNFSLRRKVPWE